jgi:hypothetical protein
MYISKMAVFWYVVWWIGTNISEESAAPISYPEDIGSRFLI